MSSLTASVSNRRFTMADDSLDLSYNLCTIPLHRHKEYIVNKTKVRSYRWNIAEILLGLILVVPFIIVASIRLALVH